MQSTSTNCEFIEKGVADLTCEELKRKWEDVWQLSLPPKISQKMLRLSLIHKLKEQAGLGLSSLEREKLNKLLSAFKRNKSGSIKRINIIKPGTRLVRMWNGKKHSVLVTEEGFEYNDKRYGSLSKIANLITGSKWNGFVFFGLKKLEGSTS